MLNDIYEPTVLPGPDGHILVTRGGYDLIRFNSDGSPDGRFQPPSNSVLKAMLPDGRLMATFETNEVHYSFASQPTGNWIDIHPATDQPFIPA